MEASEAPPIEWTTDEIIMILGINKQGARNGIQEDMLTETKGIGHLNDEDAEGIQEACGGYSKKTVANGIFVITRIHFINSSRKNGKERFTISTQQNGKDHFTISLQKNGKENFTILLQ